MNKTIKFLVLDVDGTLTDGKIYIANSGDEYKAFNVKDGYGIKTICASVGLTPMVITGRESEIVSLRCNELNIKDVYQGVSDKLSVLKKLCSTHGILPYECAYIGDDLNDKECILFINELGGFTGCPNDAHDEIKRITSYVCKAKGGEGAVREFIEEICSLFPGI